MRRTHPLSPFLAVAAGIATFSMMDAVMKSASIQAGVYKRLTVALMLLSWGYARAEAQALVPIEYSGFVWATLFGWLWFGEPVRARLWRVRRRSSSAAGSRRENPRAEARLRM